jgi:FkbM family methyltransferase
VSPLARLAALPGLSQLVELVRALPLPTPVRLLDGVRRTGTPRLWLLRSVWRRLPGARDESERVYAAYSGGDVVDVGAFHGWYTALLAPKARPGDRLVSLEPDPSAYPDLLRNLTALGSMFPHLRLWAVPEPAGDGSAVAVADPSEHHPSFRAAEGRGARSLTVDALVEAARLAPAFVKIDVEGAEWHVLAGMTSTLERHTPVVMLELHPSWQPEGVEAGQVVAVLERLGYTWDEIGDNDAVTRHLLCRPPGR